MGNVYCCMGRKANKPFYLDKICLKIYSAEELVFCICENPELLDREMFSKELLNWLTEECSARELSEKLSVEYNAKNALERCVNAVLSAAPFISAQVKNQILDIIREGDSGDSVKKRKSHADYFLKRERFSQAITEYEKMLDFVTEDENFLRGEIFHNMGIAKARLFLFDQAASDFKTAYEVDGKTSHFYCYAAALRLSLSEREYVKIISDQQGMNDVILSLEENMSKTIDAWHEDDTFREFAERKAEGALSGRQIYNDWVDDKLSELKDDYHRYVL